MKTNFLFEKSGYWGETETEGTRPGQTNISGSKFFFLLR